MSEFPETRVRYNKMTAEETKQSNEQIRKQIDLVLSKPTFVDLTPFEKLQD